MEYLKSKYSKSRYFTPSKIKPLKLDLMELSGGGTMPAQYYGKTFDGREVYCRYRGGNLSVRVGNKPEIDCFQDGQVILNETIGPPLHGSMSLHAFCNYAGITVNGKTPLDPDLERDYEKHNGANKDLSGNTVFYDVFLQSTHINQKNFIDAALKKFSDATFIQPILKRGPEKYKVTLDRFEKFTSSDELISDGFSIFFGKPPDENRIFETNIQRTGLANAFPDSLIFAVRTVGFEYPVRKYGNKDAERVMKATGKEIHVAGQIDDCLYGSFSMHSEFSTKDEKRKQITHELDTLLDHFFPKAKISHIEISSGSVRLERSFFKDMDPTILEWLNQQDNRYLAVENWGDIKEPLFVGQVAESV